jgi:hypothetical protein
MMTQDIPATTTMTTTTRSEIENFVLVLASCIIFVVGAVMIFSLPSPERQPLPVDTGSTPVVRYIETPTPLSFVPIPEPTEPYYVTAYVYGYLSRCGVYKPRIPNKESVVMLGARYYALAPCPR